MHNLFLAGVAALAFAGPALAQTAVSLDRDVTNNDALFYTSDTVFNLPTGFTNARVNIGNYTADDSSILLLNGVALYGVGIFGDGSTTGFFYFDPNGGSTPYVFQNNGAQNVSLTGPFVAGQNTIRFVVNNNNAGINAGNGPLTGGPSSLSFTGNVTFDAVAVPEPAAWALMLGGFGLVGGAMRRRDRTRVTYA